MQKGIYWRLCLSVVLTILLIGCSSNKKDESSAGHSATSSIHSEETDYYELGKEHKKYMQSHQTEPEVIYMEGKNTKITQKEIDKIVYNYKVMYDYSSEKAYEEAERFTMRREAAYFEAVKEGFTATDEEVNGIISNEKEGYETAVNKEAMDRYISGLEMTIDEYFEAQREQIKKELTIAKYWDKQKGDYLKKYTDLEPKEQEESWKAEKEKRYRKLIENQQYVRVSK